MGNRKPNKAESAVIVDEHDGAAGQENLATVVEFAKQVIAIYRPYRNASPYARHKPLRTLLKAFRHYHRLDLEDCRHQMAANLRQVFQSPPNDVSVFTTEVSEQAFAITDAFFDLVDDLYAGIPSLLTRHENELVYAYDLAIDLVAPTARIEAQQSQVESILKRVLPLHSKLLLSSEEQEQLTEDTKTIQSLLKELEKAGETEFVAQVRKTLKKGGQNK
jgi:hypothetical protein